jgi:hypothetical protein
MNTGENNSMQFTDAEVEAFIRGEKCAACGKFKAAGAIFCATDFAALSLPQRLALGDRGGPAFFGAFRAALRHLQLHAERRRQFVEGEWKYRTADELEAAGFQFSSHTRCAVPVPDRKPYECGARITIYLTPNKKRIALDALTLQPHRSKCVDPEFFERKRQEKEQKKARRSGRLQTSAGPRARARGHKGQ